MKRSLLFYYIAIVQYLGLCTCQIVITATCNPFRNTLIQRDRAIFQYSRNYPQRYHGRISCTWTYRTVKTNYINAVCTISIPCSTDALKVSRTGDATFKDQTIRLCGSGKIPIRSQGNKLALSFRSAQRTQGGRFVCKITATPKYPPTTVPTTTTASLLTTTTPSSGDLGSTCNCGARQRQRIVGGTTASKYEFPWIGMLLLNKRGPYCGATIISATWIVTAAHCTYGLLPQNLTLLLGRPNYTESQPTEQSRQVIQIISAAFDFSTFLEDISLLRVNSQLTFNEAVQPACLPFAFSNRDFSGDTVTIAGWGLTAETATTPPINLQKTDLQVVPRTNCSKALQTINSIITAKQICAYFVGKDACQGDSGGPMFWTNPATQRVYLIGIVSYGLGCARPAFPGVYTRVTSYLNWITSQTGETFCKF